MEERWSSSPMFVKISSTFYKMSIYGVQFQTEKTKRKKLIFFLMPKFMQQLSNKNLSIIMLEKNSASYFIYPLHLIGKIAGKAKFFWSKYFFSWTDFLAWVVTIFELIFFTLLATQYSVAAQARKLVHEKNCLLEKVWL